MANQFGRRRFILLGGAGLAGTVILNACTKPGSSPTATPSTAPTAGTSPTTAPVAANGQTVKVGIMDLVWSAKLSAMVGLTGTIGPWVWGEVWAMSC